MVISSSTKKEEYENVATQVNELAMEDEADTGEAVEDVENKGGKKMTPEEMHVFPISRGVIVFQVLLMLSAFYYCMLLTNWGNPTVQDTSTTFFDA